MDLSLVLIQALNAVQYGLLLFLVASGLTLIFGVMGVINLAHGSFYMMGAYLAFSLAPLTGNLLTTVVIGLVLSAAIGALLEWALFTHLYRRNHLQQVLLTYGLILIFEDLRSHFIGSDVHSVQVPDWLDFSVPLGSVMTYPAYRLFMSVVCLLVAAGLYLLIRRTRLGAQIRAGASNRDMVQILGINIDWVYRLVFALGVSLAAFAGMINAPVTAVAPGMGMQMLIVSFVVVIVGGIGSVWGALVASQLIAFADTFGKVFVPDYAGMAIYVVMAIVLLWRPEGLFKS
ncbi:branched-chain amino acid ABC transporter permease [Hydrogenophaga aromaticivorans]|jgi:branched-chain amino acid transport system permease protein|uniref:branched-chain amino acid ABC transporter permease n=1 Tax=Hydrogenophaga TaxID=47420 RepID=UPI001B3751FF|nr:MULTISPECIES: branched-chain amino acid ABC transporter permease [Hydrogenophaga]MBQ0918828.1 branched-chain amino acid ABC transporter permease [Hydrogenophaga aromaticivorans]MDO9481664.1 branched-chain amino acid ABC transporter permease [Hydrogenophaga sp.]MDP3345547.1 branched-chain amino acid ABC transporter permease [Hydrogenophaga sp.]MDP3926693.1 branched-chain amino acid ABC transporter permease [Hydrogenophaga sp.]